MPLEVETRSLDGQATAIGAAGPYTVVIDRPAESGGGGLGFNGGELLASGPGARVRGGVGHYPT
jgi:putative redox protein